MNGDFSPKKNAVGPMTQESDKTVSANCTLSPLSMGQLTEVDGYIIVARDLLQGVEALSTLPGISPRACALIAGQALECALKAFLWHKGQKPKVRHNVAALWDLAYKEKTLGIPEVPPDWVKILGRGHGPNFCFRYQEGERDKKGNRTIVNLWQTPALNPMAVELSKLVRSVEDAIES